MRISIMVILIFGFIGCVGSLKAQFSTQMGKQPKFSPEDVKKIKAGSTKLEEIREIFGEPNYISRSAGGEEVWGYIWMKATGIIKGSGRRTSTKGTGTITSDNIFLIIRFNKKKVVEAFEFSDVPPFLFR